MLKRPLKVERMPSRNLSRKEIERGIGKLEKRAGELSELLTINSYEELQLHGSELATVTNETIASIFGRDTAEYKAYEVFLQSGFAFAPSKSPHVYVEGYHKSVRVGLAKLTAAIKVLKERVNENDEDDGKASGGRAGTKVFIGHGRSSAWRELKDFVQDRLQLPWDEFNRVPVAGVTNITRLSEMLDAAAIAFLVMTGEDEMTGGGVQARMNVVHEAGLFQGRLGFDKAIIVLEDGCDEFSNIDGLGQIRFPKNNIAAAFEEIRRVMEREGLI